MPIAAIIPAAIAAAGSIGGAEIATHAGGSGTKNQQQLLNQVASTALPAGSADITAGNNALNTALGYYEKEAQGGQAATQAAGPQINALASQYRNAVNQLSQFAPRGGGTNSALENEPFSLSGAITNLLNTNQQSAIQGIGNIGNSLLGGGTSLLGTVTGAAGTSGNLSLGQQAQTDQILSSLGTSLGTLLGSGSSSGSGIGGALANLLSTNNGAAIPAPGTTDYGEIAG